MRFLIGCASVVGIAFALIGSAGSANAQGATRTWVSGIGDDGNPCSRTQPCKTFAGALSNTAAGGEINVLDPGGFGAVTITQSVSIISDQIEAGILVSSGNAIVVNVASTDKVVIEGLDLGKTCRKRIEPRSMSSAAEKSSFASAEFENSPAMLSTWWEPQARAFQFLTASFFIMAAASTCREPAGRITRRSA